MYIPKRVGSQQTVLGIVAHGEFSGADQQPVVVIAEANGMGTVDTLGGHPEVGVVGVVDGPVYRPLPAHPGGQRTIITIGSYHGV